MATTNSVLQARLSLDTCIEWGRQLRTAWETESFAQLGERSVGNTTVLASAVTQMLSSIATMQRTLQKLVAMQESKPNSAALCTCRMTAPAIQPQNDVAVEAHSLAGCLYNRYTQELWRTATKKKQQFIRADLKASVNIMLISVPVAPLDRDDVPYRRWKQTTWTMTEDLDKKTNEVLGRIDGKGRSKTAGSLRKRWRKLRVEHRHAFTALCSAFNTRKATGAIIDHCTPDSHQ